MALCQIKNIKKQTHIVHLTHTNNDNAYECNINQNMTTEHDDKIVNDNSRKS